MKVSSLVKPGKNVFSNHRNAEKKDDQLRLEEQLVGVGNFFI